MPLLERRDQSSPRLNWELHVPEGDVRGAVLLTHGYAEHRRRYAEVISAWNKLGLIIASYDLRGHGHSEGPRGHVRRFRDYVADAEDVIEAAEQDERWKAAGKPALFGHSLGGLISTHIALSRQKRYAGLAMTSPYYALEIKVPAVQKALARVVSKVAPRFAQPSGLKGSDLTHDPRLAREYDEDPLLVTRATIGWFTESEAAQIALEELAPYLKMPVLCLLAGADRVADSVVAKRICDTFGSADKEIRVVEGRFHELLNEPERETYISEIGQRLVSWTTQGSG